jgi:hypothetical protein
VDSIHFACLFDTASKHFGTNRLPEEDPHPKFGLEMHQNEKPDDPYLNAWSELFLISLVQMCFKAY